MTLDGTANVLVELQGSGGTVSGVKLELGTVATPHRSPTYADNLRACTRYYQRFGGINPYEPLGQGSAQSTTVAVIQVPLVVPIRAEPTVTSSTLALYDQTTSRATTVGAISFLGKSIIRIDFDATGLTQYRPQQLICYGSLSAYLALDAEL